MEVHTENSMAIWSVPQCPFAIEYAPRVLDDIRLTVVDAFFSLPRGGAEIGGILLGSHTRNRVRITEFQPLDCEHAFGPGFTLSDNDKAQLTRLLAAPPPGVEPVGWYHSHTRSEVFLSEPDLEIHRTFFGQPWQVAMVMKPHTFQPARVGFFFRNVDGSIHASASYREFQLEPLMMRQVPGGSPPPLEAVPSPEPPRKTPRPGRVITLMAEPVEPVQAPPPEPVAEPLLEPVLESREIEPESIVEPAEIAEPEELVEPPEIAEPQTTEEQPAVPEPAGELPSFLHAAPSRPFWSRLWVKAAAAVVVGMAIGSAAYVSRQAWLPPLLAGFERLHAPARAAAPPARSAPPPTIALNVLDADGQLQIHWDQNSAAVRGASQAVLEITDSGAPPKTFPLDAARLGSGSFTYVRQGERVDVVLSVGQPGGKALRETTTFVGNLPIKPENTAELHKRIDDLGRQNLQLLGDLKAAADRTKKLERSLADAQAQLHKQQRSRLENQIPK